MTACLRLCKLSPPIIQALHLTLTAHGVSLHSDLRMNPFQLRPRFAFEVELDPSEVISRFEQCQSEGRCAYKIKYFSEQLELKIPPAQRHTWSPQLIMAVRAHGQGTRLDGRFGPMEGVWTFFMALYAVGLCMLLGGSILWASELALNQGQLGRVLMLISGAWLLIMYAISRAGQRLGQAQMDELREFVRELVHPAQPS